MSIIGFDPSIIKTGWGVISCFERNPIFLDCGLICTKKGCIADRLHVIFTSIRDIFAKYADITHVVIEKTFLGKNVYSLAQLNMARGVIMLSCYGKKIIECEPRRVKKHITGYGNASKEDISSVICRELHIDRSLINLDISDALAMAFYGFYNIKFYGDA